MFKNNNHILTYEIDISNFKDAISKIILDKEILEEILNEINYYALNSTITIKGKLLTSRITKNHNEDCLIIILDNNTLTCYYTKKAIGKSTKIKKTATNTIEKTEVIKYNNPKRVHNYCINKEVTTYKQRKKYYKKVINYGYSKEKNKYWNNYYEKQQYWYLKNYKIQALKEDEQQEKYYIIKPISKNNKYPIYYPINKDTYDNYVNGLLSENEITNIDNIIQNKQKQLTK